VHQGLDVEALGGGDGGDVLLRQLLEYGGLTGVVKAKDEDASLALGLLELAEERKKTLRSRNMLSFGPRPAWALAAGCDAS